MSSVKSENQQVLPWRINWIILGFITYVHIAGVIGFWYITALKWQSWLLLSQTLFWSAIGVTGGLHRLWSHRSYKAHWTLRTWLMFCTSLANQGTIYHWSRDHRVHHKNSETDADPHNAKRGFFFAHMGWLLVKKDPKVIEAGKKLDLSDLERDPVVMFQKKWDPFFSQSVCFVLPTLMAHFFWNESIVAYYFVEALRYIFVLHGTWLVNSAAHLYGDHPYDEKINPAENTFVALCSAGEGWHNWHHTYPYDYAASELGSDKHYNPTKMFIDVCAYIGVVTDRKRALNAWDMLKKKKMENEDSIKAMATTFNN